MLNTPAGSVQVHERDQAVVLTVVGEPPLSTLWKTLEPFVESGKKAFVLDLGQLRYLNSTSIAAILTARNKAAACGCRLLIANLGEGVRSVFRILKLERLFDLELTVERALQSLR